MLLFKLSVVEAARDDVLIIVNDNSLDSPQVGAYYAQQRDINPANIVHVNVPGSYFISWTDFRRLRDQLIRFMQQPGMLDDPGLTPVVCLDGEPPYYCQASMDQLRAHTKIRYLVTTRGVPTRMTVDGSTLYSANAPTSVDNYLKYWLINYFAEDVTLAFTEREIAFSDGRGMRTVEPATDRELIVGRIDGLDLSAAKALVDRAMAVEDAGIYGTWYGSTKFWSLKNADTGAAIYPKSDRSVLGWRYALGLWGEDRAECSDYLDFSGFLAEGKAPAHCRVKFNDDSDPARQSTLNINYPPPGNTRSRMPLVVDALGYQGWLDGQATLGSFATLLNWRKNDQCTVTLCDNAPDPAACRVASSDIFAELNTDCVGVADGFMAYNHTSYPVSYLAVWPTGWFQSARIGNSGWNGGGHGDLNQLAFPEVSSDAGFDDNNSLWFRNTDQVASPLCYASSDFTLVPDQPCVDARRVVLSQKMTLAPQALDMISPQTYRVAVRYQTRNIANNVDLRVRLFIHETGAGDVLIDYGVKTLAVLTPVDTTGWTAAEVVFTLDPILQTGISYDGIKITIDTPNAFTGDLGIDVVSVQETTTGLELASNGSFSLGHRQAATGDHAATFLSRLGGVAAWGSVGHHQSGGSAFAGNGLEILTYFLRGLPLGDAVWFNESNNSGLLYGDPLYSPVAVRLNPFDIANIQNGRIELVGSTVNGRDPTQVSTSYRIDVCPGSDFYTCDQAQSWLATGISGTGGSENTLLGSLDTTLLPVGDYTLRLQVNSLHSVSGRSQTIADYYTAFHINNVNNAPVAVNTSLDIVEDTVKTSFLQASDADADTLTYSIVSNGTKGTATITNATTGIYSYTPNPDATGTDSFTFKANDGLLDSNIATVTVNITAVNDAPVASAGTLATNEDTVAGGILSASDVDNDPLTYSLVNNASQGIVTITDSATGAYSYTPNANVTGTDTDSFTFKVNDGQVDSNTATVTITINPINNAPVANNDSASVDEGQSVNINLAINDTDIEAPVDLTSIVIATVPSNGTIVVNANGTVDYTHDGSETVSDSFTYTILDTGGTVSNSALVSLTVIPQNDAPLATSVSISIFNNEPVTVTLDAIDADGDPLEYSLVSMPSQGTLALTNASVDTFTYTYTPNIDATGIDSFTYSVNDGLLESNIATVTIQFLEVAAVTGESAPSGGSLNLLFVLLFSLLSGLRFIPVYGVLNRSASAGVIS